MSEVVTILHQGVHSKADGEWQQLELPHQPGLSIKHYLHQKIGLTGVRSARALKLRAPDGKYYRIRMTYTPKPGDVVALTPKDW